MRLGCAEECCQHRQTWIRLPRCAAIFEGPVLSKLDGRRDYGEEPNVAIGSLEGIILTVIYTDREGERRIISIRRANRKERRAYAEAIGVEDGLGSAARDERR